MYIYIYIFLIHIDMFSETRKKHSLICHVTIPVITN